MRSEDEIKKYIEITEKRAEMYYQNGGFIQHNYWLNFAEGLKWALEEEESK